MTAPGKSSDKAQKGLDNKWLSSTFSILSGHSLKGEKKIRQAPWSAFVFIPLKIYLPEESRFVFVVHTPWD